MPYTVESWVVGADACEASARSARPKEGDSAPVDSATRSVTAHAVAAVERVGVVVVHRGADVALARGPVERRLGRVAARCSTCVVHMSPNTRTHAHA